MDSAEELSYKVRTRNSSHVRQFHSQRTQSSRARPVVRRTFTRDTRQNSDLFPVRKSQETREDVFLRDSSQMTKWAQPVWILLTLATYSLSCTLAPAYNHEDYPRPAITVSYFVTYPTTPSAKLEVFSDGILVFNSLRGRQRLGSLSAESFLTLVSLVEQQALRNSLAALDAQRFDKILTDLTALEISAGSSQAVVPLDQITPEVRSLLVEVDALFQAELGRNYRHFLREVGAIH